MMSYTVITTRAWDKVPDKIQTNDESCILLAPAEEGNHKEDEGCTQSAADKIRCPIINPVKLTLPFSSEPE